ncbi:hypothetical protein MPSEU_000909100 [Mayamaea pseudoterrestris]|nr:hypothetical protein MPSEU_000909100 [Mayamaea pseudoterrestris]
MIGAATFSHLTLKETMDNTSDMILEKAEAMNGHDASAVAASETSFISGSAHEGAVEDAPLNESTSRATKQSFRKQNHRRYLRDAISFEVPLNVTADVGVAMKRTRERRLAALQQSIPSVNVANTTLPTNVKTSSEEKKMPGDGIDGDGDSDDDSMADAANNNVTSPDAADASTQPAGKKRKRRTREELRPQSIMPRRSDFGNMYDYLEAKYVQGVMVNDDDDRNINNGVGDDDEGAGSVYSETSFFDDSDLRRTVAEQVMAQSTTTKMELQNEQDADEFFVNVGTLEVEETEWTTETYDPLTDTNVSPKKRQRKPKAKIEIGDGKSVSSNKSNVTAATANGNKKKVAAAATASSAAKSPALSIASIKASKKQPNVVKGLENHQPIAKQKLSSATAASDNAAAAAAASPQQQNDDTMHEQSAVTAERKAKAMHYYDELVAMIKNCSPDDLPRRKTSERVAVTCPPDKHPGDLILFHNPHVPGQKLRVKIPKNTLPGGIFKATVPVPPDPDDDTIDHNKLSRHFYDTLDDYTRSYDDWIDSEAMAQRALHNHEYAPHREKRKKFDELIMVFPANLKTTVDIEYMKKLLRRARQNRSKREQTLARKGSSPPKDSTAHGSSGSVSSSQQPLERLPLVKSPGAAAKKPKLAFTATTPALQVPKDVAAPAGPKVSLPVFSTTFTTKLFDMDDFERVDDEE